MQHFGKVGESIIWEVWDLFQEVRKSRLPERAAGGGKLVCGCVNALQTKTRTRMFSGPSCSRFYPSGGEVVSFDFPP